MNKKIFIGVGHGGKDPGAVGNGMRESAVNLTISLVMRDILESRGFKVLLSRVVDEDDRLSEEIAECNAFNPDIAVEVHTNAGGGTGFEIYVPDNSQDSKRLAEMIAGCVEAIGRKNRGIKRNPKLGWTKYVKAPCVLCEGFFIDSAEGSEMRDINKQKALAIAYTEGILKYFGVSSVEDMRELVKEKYGFSDFTMCYLDSYKYAPELYERLLK